MQNRIIREIPLANNIWMPREKAQKTANPKRKLMKQT